VYIYYTLDFVIGLYRPILDLMTLRMDNLQPADLILGRNAVLRVAWSVGQSVCLSVGLSRS